jgi:hypothetical protein
MKWKKCRIWLLNGPDLAWENNIIKSSNGTEIAMFRYAQSEYKSTYLHYMCIALATRLHFVCIAHRTTMHCSFRLNALQMHCVCISCALQTHCRCIASALQMHCKRYALQMHCKCIADALQMHCKFRRKVSSVLCFTSYFFRGEIILWWSYCIEVTYYDVSLLA